MSDSTEETEDENPLNSLIILFPLLFIAFVACGSYFHDAWLQHRSATFPSTDGLMSKYYWNVYGDVGERELEVEYSYGVNGKLYSGTRKRFAYRFFSSGSPEAIALARSWGEGKKVKVFYDPDAPEVSALDNLFTPGDVKTLVAGLVGFLLAPVFFVVGLRELFLKHYGMRFGKAADDQKSELDSQPMTVGAN